MLTRVNKKVSGACICIVLSIMKEKHELPLLISKNRKEEKGEKKSRSTMEITADFKPSFAPC